MPIWFGSTQPKENGDEMGYVVPPHDIRDDEKKLVEWYAEQILYYRRMKLIVVVASLIGFLFLAFCATMNELRKMEEAEEPLRVEEDL